MFSFPLHARPLLTHFSKELWRSRWGSSSCPWLCPVQYVPNASGSCSQEKLHRAAHGPGFKWDRLASVKQHAGFTSYLEKSQGLQALWKIPCVTVFSSHVNQNIRLCAGIILLLVVLAEIQRSNPCQTSLLYRSNQDSGERANVVAPEGLDSLGAREGFAGISEVINKHFHVYEGSNCFLKPSQELNNNQALTHMPSSLLWGLKTVGA